MKLALIVEQSEVTKDLLHRHFAQTNRGVELVDEFIKTIDPSIKEAFETIMCHQGSALETTTDHRALIIHSVQEKALGTDIMIFEFDLR